MSISSEIKETRCQVEVKSKRRGVKRLCSAIVAYGRIDPTLGSEIADC